jgi:hypothetical protein
MVQEGELRSTAGVIRLGDEWNNATAAGEIHSNIEGTGGYSVTDYDTGEAIATGIRYESGKTLHIAGSPLGIRKIDQRRLEARRGSNGPDAAKWSYHTKAMLKEGGQAQAVKRFLGIADNIWPVIQFGGSCAVFHFGGSRTQALLELLAKKAGDAAIEKIDGWMLVVSGEPALKPTWLTSTGPGIVRLMVENDLDRIEKRLCRPRANKRLPRSLRVQEALEWLNLEERLEHFANARFEMAPADCAGKLVEFIGD